MATQAELAAALKSVNDLVAKSKAKRAVKASTKAGAPKAKIKAAPEPVRVAPSRPNLRKVKKLADRGVLSAQEFVAAVQEALKSVRASSNMIALMGDMLSRALEDEVETIEVQAKTKKA